MRCSTVDSPILLNVLRVWIQQTQLETNGMHQKIKKELTHGIFDWEIQNGPSHMNTCIPLFHDCSHSPGRYTPCILNTEMCIGHFCSQMLKRNCWSFDIWPGDFRYEKIETVSLPRSWLVGELEWAFSSIVANLLISFTLPASVYLSNEIQCALAFRTQFSGPNLRQKKTNLFLYIVSLMRNVSIIYGVSLRWLNRDCNCILSRLLFVLGRKKI